VSGIADGVAEASRAAAAPIVGGDTVRGDVVSLTITVLGVAPHPWTRAGAQPGGRVYVTGILGGPLAALRALESGAAVAAAARRRFVHPTPRLAESRWLAGQPIAAAIDVSDGLVSDVAHLAAAGNVRIILDLDRVPRLSGVTAVDAAASGEEYELALITPPGASLDTAAFVERFALPLTEIGTVIAPDPSPGVHALVAGRRVDPPRGYDHFSR
jgi:thiamine-monophosphate kinase